MSAGAENAVEDEVVCENFRSRERKFQELSLPRHVTFGHRRRLHGGDRPHGTRWGRSPTWPKSCGGDALKLPTQEF